MSKTHTDIVKHYMTIEREEYLSADIKFVSTRLLSYWILKGVTKPINGGGKRRKLSFLELCWLKIVADLRELDVNFEIIRIIKEKLFAPINLSDADHSKFPDRNFLHTQLAKTGPLSKTSLDNLSNEMAPVYAELKHRESTPLELHILIAIGLRSPLSLIILPNGDLIPYAEKYLEDYLADEKFMNIFRSTHLTISITSVIKYFIMSDDFSFPYKRVFLSETDQQVLEALKVHKPISMTIKFKNGDVEIIEVTKKKNIDLKSRISDILLTKGYEEITVKTQKGEIVYCLQTTKIKVNSNTG